MLKLSILLVTLVLNLKSINSIDFVGSFSQNAAKIVHYAVKVDEKLQVKSLNVDSLENMDTFDNWFAKAVYDGENYNKTGWSILEIETNKNANDYEQAFAAGFLEGYLTKDLISLHILNNVGSFCQNPSTDEQCIKIINYLKSNFNWTREQLVKYGSEDAYWHQFNGLYNGYKSINEINYNASLFLEKAEIDITPYLNLMFLQLSGDLPELIASIYNISDPFILASCSALIKVLPNSSDLYVSHVTWEHYESMLRILKHFKLHYHYENLKSSSLIPGSEVSFSSYPGVLVSFDDFYITKANLVVLETTIVNSNVDLWKFVKPDTNFYWIRNLIANRLSTNGKEWSTLYSLYNSGTYNNQFMIIDYKQFYPNENLRDGLLTILEQMPGKVIWSDKTDLLREQSYWPSYNLPYYPEVYNSNGDKEAYEKYGTFFSYENCSRANIFRRDHHNVIDIDSMIKLMRSNNYTEDPYSRCECNPPYSADLAISSRSDLNSKNGTYQFPALGHGDHGATDMKLTNVKMMKNFELIAINGPTFDDDLLTPFSWATCDFANITNHFGLTETFRFEPVQVQWYL